MSQATEALREHGFTVSEIEQSCGLRAISAMLTNATGGSSADVLEREGVVSCFVLATPRADVQDLVVGDTASASAVRRLANLQCSLWGAEAPIDEEVRRLDRAFDYLKRVIPS